MSEAPLQINLTVRGIKVRDSEISSNVKFFVKS